MEEQAYQPKTHWFLYILSGVIMPAISITVEATTHICAEAFFDPIPTTWHLLLVIFVPLAQLQVFFAIRKGAPNQLKLAGFINAIVIGISIFYSIIYLSIVPLALLTVLIGLGFLPLAPYFSLVTALLMRHKLNRIAATSPPKSFTVKKRGLAVALFLTLGILALIELPATLTRIGLQKAVSDSPQTRAEGIRFLRTYGSKDALLRSCYDQTGTATDLIGYALWIRNPITPDEAQKIYYRVTGETFDSSLPPERIGGRLIPQDTVDFDRDQGGSRIHGKLKGLSLADSKLEASVDGNGGVGYMEWTLVFRNESLAQREARTEVQLPPGGVVSRLSLWVNGEPREAAFAGRGKVTQAYQQVAIRQRRDPVLVTTAGRDRILVQCFPVPPNGEMKIRFGITLPLPLEELNRAQLLLPYFADRNFRIPDDVYHAVKIRSKTRLWPSNETFRTGMEGSESILSGSIRDEELSQATSAILVDRSDVKEMWSRDPFEKGFVIQQRVEERTPAHLQRIVLVVDTSETMHKWVPHLQNAVASLPRDFDVKMIPGDAEIVDGLNLVKYNSDNPADIESALRGVNFVGGADNLPGLVKAWDLAAEKPGNNAIVWIHDPQRILIRPAEELKQRWNNRPYGPTLYSVQATRGADEIEKALDGIDEVKLLPRTGALDEDLKFLFARLTGRMKTYEFVRSSKKPDENQNSAVWETSDHLARLWANDEVARILAPRDASLEDEAIILAARYQLVTPVSGAVVLETEQQYRANDLKPVDAGTVPTIPEPEMIVLFIVAAVFMVWLTYMKYRKSGPGRCTV